MAEEFSKSILIKVVAQICKMVGFETIMTTPLEVLADILKRFILKLGRISLQYGVHSGHSVISLRDLSLALHDCGILPNELVEFLKLVSPLPKSITVPKYPVIINNPNTPHDISKIYDYIEIENIPPDGGRESFEIENVPPDGGHDNFEIENVAPDGGQDNFEIENALPDGRQENFEIENVPPVGGQDNFKDSRGALKIKISFSKITEACKAKKSKNKKNKRKRKRKKQMEQKD